MGESKQKMRAQKECFACLINQAKSWNPHIAEKYLATLHRNEDGSHSQPPPYLAIELYGRLAQDQGVKDLYKDIKLHCITKAHQLLENVNPSHFNPKEGLEFGALGNVIDYGSASNFEIHQFDFENERKNLEFACFDFEAFTQAIQKAKKIVVIGDNAGENLFDEIMIASLKTHYPQLEFFYFVRGYPIINDLTLSDLNHPYCKNIFSLAQVVDSGVRSPGFIYTQSTLEAQKIYDNADLIIAKGMGNYECMEESKDSRVFFLLKIKCQVVAKSLNLPAGKMVFKQNL